MSMLFLKWEEDASGVPHALFREGSRVVAFSRGELEGPLSRLYNTDWLMAVDEALATHEKLVQSGAGQGTTCRSAIDTRVAMSGSSGDPNAVH